MPLAAPFGDGPWGEAIRYWLRKKKLRQSELAAETGIRANTISRIVRGFPAQTRSLESIAKILQVPFEDVLVSPLRRGADDTKRQFLREIIDDALRTIDGNLDETTLEWAKRLQALPADLRRDAIDAIENLENAERQHKRRTKPPSKKR